jgi:hypothetical protein
MVINYNIYSALFHPKISKGYRSKAVLLIQEDIPQAWGGSTEGPVSHGPKFGSGYVKEV